MSKVVKKDERRLFGNYTEIPITGIWLRRIGDKAQVLIEINGKWRLVVEEYCDASFSHIAECVDNGDRWPLDKLTE